jgi:hypothetical protein
MWTTLLASYAAMVSTSSLVVSYISYRSSGPVLSGEAEISAEIYRGKFDGPALWVDLYNRGRGPVTVHSAMIWAGGNTGPVKGILEVGWLLDSDECSLPSRIEGHSGEHWVFPAREFAKAWLTRSDLQSLKVDIKLAHGKRLLLKVDTSAIDRLDRQNLPDWEPDYFTGKEFT